MRVTPLLALFFLAAAALLPGAFSPSTPAAAKGARGLDQKG